METDLFAQRFDAFDIDNRPIFGDAKVDDEWRNDGTTDLQTQCGQSIEGLAKVFGIGFHAHQGGVVGRQCLFVSSGLAGSLEHATNLFRHGGRKMNRKRAGRRTHETLRRLMNFALIASSSARSCRPGIIGSSTMYFCKSAALNSRFTRA